MISSNNQTADMETINTKGAVGNLKAILQKPALNDGEKCPLVILMHGFTANKNIELLTTLADKLLQSGMATLRFDFDGHGESDGAFEDMTVPKEIKDAENVYNYAVALPFVDKISLLGHSQGGVVASMLGGELGADKIACIVLMAPAAALRDDALNGRTRGNHFDPHNIPEYIPFGDYKVGRAYLQTAQTLPIYETAEKYTGAVCLIHGKSDTTVDCSYSVKYHEVYKNSELHLIDGEVHRFTEHMDEVVKIAVDFLNKNTHC